MCFLADYAQIISLAGKGSFSKVYKAKRNTDKKLVAVKQMQISSNEKNPNMVQTLFREARMIKSLTHPNIAGFERIIKQNNEIFLVMEYCGDVSLSSYLKSKKDNKLSEARAFPII